MPERGGCQCEVCIWVHNRILDSGFRRNDASASFVIPGKAAGRDPESRRLYVQEIVMLPVPNKIPAFGSKLTNGYGAQRAAPLRLMGHYQEIDMHPDVNGTMSCAADSRWGACVQ
jgi:hypothetical protein